MNTLHTLGRWVFAVPFLVFGALHLLNSGQMAGFVPSFFPGNPAMWVVITGIVFIVSALGVALHKFEKEAALLISFQLLVFVLTIWLPQILAGNQAAMSGLLKDTALLGAALAFAGLAAHEKNHMQETSAPAPSTPSTTPGA